MSEQEPISENISENKRRPGRPCKFSREDYDRVAKLEGPAQSARGKQNYLYAVRAFQVLDAERFSYLFSPKQRLTILAELGRVDHPRVMVALAAEICGSRLTTEKAVGLIRRTRGNHKPNSSGLSKAIRRAIDRFRERYPDVSRQEIVNTLSALSIDYH